MNSWIVIATAALRGAAVRARLRRALLGGLVALSSCGGGNDDPAVDEGNNRIPVHCQADRRACI